MDLTQHQSVFGTSAGIKLRRDEDNQQDKAVATRRILTHSHIFTCMSNIQLQLFLRQCNLYYKKSK